MNGLKKIINENMMFKMDNRPLKHDSCILSKRAKKFLNPDNINGRPCEDYQEK